MACYLVVFVDVQMLNLEQLSQTGGTTTSGGSTPRGQFGIAGTSRGAAPFSDGGGKIITIGKNLPFAGRQMGGGTRAQVPGSRGYGADYPSNYAPGQFKGSYVQGRGFPFGFWPITWGYVVTR